ncbi:uncharacterized protein PG986_011056 [Apiospora aurea]|uniref:Uncharacterized protein n=1 Tax=Apiospora aurea TaxID=335848 RepID=A0ABR1Q453_9PEZI
MGVCCGLFGSRRAAPSQMAPPVAARPAQLGLEGVEFSPSPSFASSDGEDTDLAPPSCSPERSHNCLPRTPSLWDITRRRQSFERLRLDSLILPRNSEGFTSHRRRCWCRPEFILRSRRTTDSLKREIRVMYGLDLEARREKGVVLHLGPMMDLT